MIKRICIICEGYEEKEYLTRLINKNIFNSCYDIILINAKSLSYVFHHYTEKYNSDSYHIVLIFCDADKNSLQFKTLQNDLKSFHNPNISDKLITFANPCTMQIFLSHFKKVKLTSPSKHSNEKIISEIANIKNYDAKEKQRKELMSKINRKNYNIMKENLSYISTNIKDIPSTNFLELINNLENDDFTWIDNINNSL